MITAKSMPTTKDLEELADETSKIPASKLSSSITVSKAFHTCQSILPADTILQCYSVETIPEPVFNSCFNLVRNNLRGLYRTSSFGWSDSKKKKEMKESPTRFIVLQHGIDKVVAFISFQIVIEGPSLASYWYIKLSCIMYIYIYIYIYVLLRE